MKCIYFISLSYHSIYLRRFRPKTVFVLTTKSRWKLLSSAACTIKAFINLTLYLSSDFYEIIEFLKISSDYILFICVFLDQNRFFVFLFKPRWKLLSSAVIIKVFINLTLYLSSNFYERIEFLKIFSDYILFICVVIDQNRIFEFLFKPRWKLLSSAVIIKVFINLTLYLSSNFYEIIEFLKNLSEYIVFIYIRIVFY